MVKFILPKNYLIVIHWIAFSLTTSILSVQRHFQIIQISCSSFHYLDLATTNNSCLYHYILWYLQKHIFPIEVFSLLLLVIILPSISSHSSLIIYLSIYLYVCLPLILSHEFLFWIISSLLLSKIIVVFKCFLDLAHGRLL